MATVSPTKIISNMIQYKEVGDCIRWLDVLDVVTETSYGAWTAPLRQEKLSLLMGGWRFDYDDSGFIITAKPKPEFDEELELLSVQLVEATEEQRLYKALTETLELLQKRMNSPRSA